MKNYKPFNFTPRNIRNQARKTRLIPMMPQVCVELNVKRGKGGSKPVSAKNNSINTNNPPTNRRKEKITVNFDGGVQGIYYHQIY